MLKHTDPTVWSRYDAWGDPILKPHEREARDIGALAFDRVLAGMKAAREASPRAHVVAWQRTRAGMAHEQAKIDAARAECKAMAAQMMRDMRRAA